MGADYDSRYVESSGSVYIYQLNDSIWKRKNILYPKIRVSYAGFGYELGFNTKYNELIVSAPSDSGFLGSYAGNVYIFQKEDSHWVEKQILSPDSGGIFQRFGHSVKTQGDYLFVGAPGGAYYQSGGSVYAYKRRNNYWEFFNKIISPLNSYRDYFGSSLDLDLEYNKLLVGAPGESSGGQRKSLTIYILLLKIA